MRVDFPKNKKQQECIFCGCPEYLLQYNGLVMCPKCMKDRNIHGDFLDYNQFEAAQPQHETKTDGRVIWVDRSVFCHSGYCDDAKFSNSK